MTDKPALKQCLGFTLLEVLVALGIISIALLATLRVAGQGINNFGDLQKRQLAEWVAHNRLAERRIKNEWITTGTLEGVDSLNSELFFLKEIVTSTPNPRFRKIEIYVKAKASDSNHLAHVTGYLVNFGKGQP